MALGPQSRGGLRGVLALVVGLILFVVFLPRVMAAAQLAIDPKQLNSGDYAAVTQLGDGKTLTAAGYALVSRDVAMTLWIKETCSNPDDVAACNKETGRQFRVMFWRDWRGYVNRVEITGVDLLDDPAFGGSLGAPRAIHASCVRVYGATAEDLIAKSLPSKYCK
jgi:hypothetical protein